MKIEDVCILYGLNIGMLILSAIISPSFDMIIYIVSLVSNILLITSLVDKSFDLSCEHVSSIFYQQFFLNLILTAATILGYFRYFNFLVFLSNFFKFFVVSEMVFIFSNSFLRYLELCDYSKKYDSSTAKNILYMFFAYLFGFVISTYMFRMHASWTNYLNIILFLQSSEWVLLTSMISMIVYRFCSSQKITLRGNRWLNSIVEASVAFSSLHFLIKGVGSIISKTPYANLTVSRLLQVVLSRTSFILFLYLTLNRFTRLSSSIKDSHDFVTWLRSFLNIEYVVSASVVISIFYNVPFNFCLSAFLLVKFLNNIMSYESSYKKIF